jgi:succinate dehydrogenase / fumarate reductase flavoprotein subunit
MQGLADGYFVLPYVVGNYLANLPVGWNKGESKVDETHPEAKKAVKAAEDRVKQFIDVGQKGSRTVDDFHRRLGAIIWDHCGMSRNAEGLKKALEEIPALHAEFREEVKILGSGADLNRELEKAMRVDDFFELGALMCRDALERDESAGCHFREEHQKNGECVRNDEKFAHVAAWEWKGEGKPHERHEEKLDFEYIKMVQRSY